MHAHVNFRARASATSPSLMLADEDILSEEHLAVCLANGVTTVQRMHGSREMLRLRDRIEAGDIVGPRLVVGTPRLDGLPESDPYVRVAETPDEGVAFVDASVQAGYDFLKIYDGLDGPTYDAVIARAHARGMRVDGHVARTLPLARSLAGTQDHIGHIEEFVGYANGYSQKEADRLAAQVARSRVGVTPTLAIFQNVIASIEDLPATLTGPTIVYQDPLIYAGWLPSRSGYVSARFQGEAKKAALKRQYAFMRMLTASMHRAGVPLAVGTDCNVASTICGFSYVDELKTLHSVGLSTKTVLKMATLEGARAMRMTDRLGTIESGHAADLVLLNRNPLLDLQATRDIAGVMVRGRWLDRAELDDRLLQMQKRFAALDARLPPEDHRRIR